MFCSSDMGYEEVDKTGSYFNQFETEVVAKLIQLLLAQGVSPYHIGVIALYNAQVAKITECLQKDNPSIPTTKKRKPRKKIKKKPKKIKKKHSSDEDIVDTEEEDRIKNPFILDEAEGDTEEEVVDEEEDSNIDTIARLDVRAIQISSVDAFQGAEKEVIIVTCSRTTNLGFIASTKRLNVAITRAKRHLFIVGKHEILRGDVTWREVITNAELIPGGCKTGSQILSISSFDELAALPDVRSAPIKQYTTIMKITPKDEITPEEIEEFLDFEYVNDTSASSIPSESSNNIEEVMDNLTEQELNLMEEKIYNNDEVVTKISKRKIEDEPSDETQINDEALAKVLNINVDNNEAISSETISLKKN